MNGYNDISAEPSDDEDLAIAYGFEIIYEDELDEMFTLSYIRKNPKSSSSSTYRRGNGKLPPNKSTSSFASAASSGVSSMLPKPMSSCSLSSHVSEMSDGDYCSSTESGDASERRDMMDVDDHNGLQLSVENIWYIIQHKRHPEEEGEMKTSRHHFMTMEHASNHNRLTEWFANLIHLPEKIRQQAAEKRRFNVNKIPKEIRDELKHIYVY